MKRSFCISVGLFCIALFSMIVLAEDLPATRKVKCPVCGMFVAMFTDWNARIEFKDSSVAVFDGTKCMFKYFLDINKYDPSKSRNNINSVVVNDYYSKSPTDALRAYYVIWGDVLGPMGYEPIPFATQTAAKKFLKEHKGRKIIRFKDVDLKLIVSLDNP